MQHIMTISLKKKKNLVKNRMYNKIALLTFYLISFLLDLYIEAIFLLLLLI
jgi:hypothetical protein